MTKHHRWSHETPPHQPEDAMSFVSPAASLQQKHRDRQNARYAADPQKYRDRQNARYAADPQKHRDRKNAQYAADPQKQRDRKKALYAADPQKHRIQSRRSKAKRKAEIYAIDIKILTDRDIEKLSL